MEREEYKPKSKFDYELLAELKLSNPNEEKIRELVSQGANIKGGFLMYIFYELLETIGTNENTGDLIFKFILNLKAVELLIQLGADVNYSDDGFNCLFEACYFCESPELVELLLKNGANKNCVQEETKELLLDALDFELWYREQADKDSGAGLSKCIDVLVR